MARAFRTIVTVAVCGALGACASIGTVNGVNLDQGRMGVQNATNQTFCDTRPWFCIVVAAGTVGGILAIMAARGNSRGSTYHPMPD